MKTNNLMEMFLTLFFCFTSLAIGIILIRIKRQNLIQNKKNKVAFYNQQIDSLIKINQYRSALKLIDSAIKETNDPYLKLRKTRIILRTDRIITQTNELGLNQKKKDNNTKKDSKKEFTQILNQHIAKTTINTNHENLFIHNILIKVEEGTISNIIDRSDEQINLLRDLFEKKSISYNDVLGNPKWKSKRLEVITRDNFSCKNCHKKESNGNPLQAHHKYYIKGRLPWEYSLNEFETLCRECHKDWHSKNDAKIYTLINNQLVEEVLIPCSRCGGDGYFEEYKHVDNGICFKCGGSKFEASVFEKKIHN